MEAISCVKAVVIAASQYENNPCDAQLVHLQRQLDILVTVTSKGGCSAFLPTEQLLTAELFSCLVNIMDKASNTKPSLAQRVLQLFSQFEREAPLRECLRDTFNVNACLANFLRGEVSSSTEPSSTGQEHSCVKLLQKFTYDCRIPYHENYMVDLLKFVLKNVQSKETELTQPCLGLLANLCRHNISVQTHLKNKENIRALYKVLMRYLSHESRTMVVFALSVVASLCLHDEIGEKLFKSCNIHQTLQLMFNILLNGEVTVTRTYVVDLFKDLLQHSGIQLLFSKYSHLEPCIKQVLPLLCSKDSEAVSKVLELLLALCAVNGLRRIVCESVLSAASLKSPANYKELCFLKQIDEPLVAMLYWAAQSVNTHNSTPLLALEFLREIFEEMLNLGLSSKMSSRMKLLLPVLNEAMKASMSSENSSTKQVLEKTVKALRLLKIMCAEDIFVHQVKSLIEANMYSLVVEFQLLHNSVGRSAVNKDWNEPGVDVVLSSLELMLALKPGQPAVEKPLTSFLQDARLVPFIAYGITSGVRERVQTCLQLVAKGSLLEDFPALVLGDSIAASNLTRIKTAELNQSRSDQVTPPSAKRLCYSAFQDKENCLSVNQSVRSLSTNESTRHDLDSTVQTLIDKMETGMELKDLRASDIIGVYEHRLQSLQTKENHLQDLLDTKALALSQADRLLSQYRCRLAQSDAESTKLRLMVAQFEKKCEENKDQLNDLLADKERMQSKLDHYAQETSRLEAIAEEHKELTQSYAEQKHRLENLQRSHGTLKQEHTTLTEMHEMQRRHNETLKQQNDIATEQLQQLEDERKNLANTLKEKESQLTDKTKALNKSETALKKVTKDRDELESAIDKLRGNLTKAESEKKELKHQVKSLELVCKQHEEAIAEKDAAIREQKVQISKHSQIAALIHDLSAGKNPNAQIPS